MAAVSEKANRLYPHRLLFILALVAILSCVNVSSNAQGCPYNIDFETGTFAGWTCSVGTVRAVGITNVISLTPVPAPIPSLHDILTANTSYGVDHYGAFPLTCPNGSGYSVRLGNESNHYLAQGISYEFTIPANQNEFTLTYNYAFVLNRGRHSSHQQARFEVEVIDVTGNYYAPCGYFTFSANDTTVPGITKSIYSDNIWYKNWTAVTVDLPGRAGRTFRLVFKIAGCTDPHLEPNPPGPPNPEHFGYAYIDVNSQCTDALLGSVHCKTDSVLKVAAPYGFDNYTWYDSTLTHVLGTGPDIIFRPPPPSGTKIAVVTAPSLYFGCPQTTYIRLFDTLTVTANAGRDTAYCTGNGVRIGSPPKYGYVYKWAPATGLSNPNISNPIANPSSTTRYVVTVKPLGGGTCTASDTVEVRRAPIDNSLQIIGSQFLCTGGGTILKVAPTDSIQWYRNDTLIPGATRSEYLATTHGIYHATLSNRSGCSGITIRQVVVILTTSAPPNAGFTITSPVNQCLAGNRFTFANTSTNPPDVSYKWQMGDGSSLATRDATHSYLGPGTFKVYLLAESPACTSVAANTVQVFPGPVPAFTVAPVCINQPATLINNTVDTGNSPISYLWSLSNGQTSTLRNPPPQVYAVAGNYPVVLSVSTIQCPATFNAVTRTLVVAKPVPAINYPVQYAFANIPLQLQARQAGTAFLWSPGTNLNDRTIPNPVFRGLSDQTYTIAVTATSGCISVDTQVVKMVKTIEIYVPTAFTPNQDGKNDYLRPITTGATVRHFRVYNRLGQVLYEMKGSGNGWNGTTKSIPQQTQTLVWTLEALGADGKMYIRNGTTVLIR